MYLVIFFFFFNDTATTEIYTLSLHDALPIRSLCQARVRGETRPTVVGSIEDINSGWKTAIDLGARILNLSFGTAEDILGPNDPIPHTELVQYALARDC